MKKSILFVFTLLMISQIGFGQFSFGAGVTLADFGQNSFGLQAKAIKDINEKVDVAATYNYFFEDFTTMAFEGDVHYRLLETENDLRISALAGLRYTTISAEGISVNNTSLQIGAFGLIALESLNLYVEPKWILDEGGGFVISAGVIF